MTYPIDHPDPAVRAEANLIRGRLSLSAAKWLNRRHQRFGQRALPDERQRREAYALLHLFRSQTSADWWLQHRHHDMEQILSDLYD